MKRVKFALLIAFVALVAPCELVAAFDLFEAEAAIEEGRTLTETIWRASVGDGEYDKVGLHRYRHPGIEPRAAMLYLPGTNMNGELAITDEDHNLWLYLADRGIEVYALDYRTHFVPNEPVPDDFSFMRDWTVQAFVDDAALAVDHMRKSAGDLPVYVAGFSRGVTYAYALTGQRSLAGLVVLDGSFKQYDAPGFDRNDAMQKLAASGQYGTVLSRSRGWSSRTEMMRRTWQNPDGPAMGNFKTIGEQLTSTLYWAWGEGGLANPVDGISSIEVLAKGMEGYDRYFPMIQNIEGRSIGAQRDDPATALDDHFGDMSLPIIYFGATNMGADNLMNGIYSASKSGSKDVTINVLENHGHVDVLFGNRAKDLVFEVVYRWILDH